MEGTYDVVLLCCKAYDLMDAISAIAPAMGEQSVVLPFLNGVRHIDVLTETFGPQRVLGGLTVINAALMPDGTIQQSELRINITAIGELDGRISSRCAAIKMALEAGGIPVQVSDDIVVACWSDRKFRRRRILLLFRPRGMHASSDGGRVPPATRHGWHYPGDIFPTELDLWTVPADRHGGRPSHRR